MKMLNVGCGNRFHTDWVNIDMRSPSEEVIEYDLRTGLPFNDNEFDAVYSSHVLEHIDKKNGKKFIEEQYRILKNGGIIRVVVPDLEYVVKNYLKQLEQVLSGDAEAEYKYDWAMIELYDQVIREESGGEILKYIDKSKNDMSLSFMDGGNVALNFAKMRHGKYIQEIIEGKNEDHFQELPLMKKINMRNISNRVSSARIKLCDLLVKTLGGKEQLQAYKEGQFRNSGEIHRYMYDKFSLKRLLESIGFSNVVQQTAYDSKIKNFVSYNLDTENGEVIKPDSLFMEATK